MEGGQLGGDEWTRHGSFVNKPTRGWLHSDSVVSTSGVSYTVRVSNKDTLCTPIGTHFGPEGLENDTTSSFSSNPSCLLLLIHFENTLTSVSTFYSNNCKPMTEYFVITVQCRRLVT